VTRARLGLLGGAVLLVALGVLRYFFWIDLGAGCVLTLRPSLVGYDNMLVKRALETLRQGSPDDYRKVCEHVGTINPNPSCGGFGGGCFWHGQGQQGRTSIDVSTEHGLQWTVAVIVHETCHAIQFHEGRPPGHDFERECYGEDDRILRSLVRLR
jgi:hypothetical protein